MTTTGSVIAMFPDHEAAVKELAASGIALSGLSIVGKGDHTEENVAVRHRR